MKTLLLLLLPLLVKQSAVQPPPVFEPVPTLSIFDEQRGRGVRTFVAVEVPGIEGVAVDLWTYEDSFRRPQKVETIGGKMHLLHEFEGNRLETVLEPEPGGLNITATLTVPEPAALEKSRFLNMCITYQRSVFANEKDHFDDSYVTDFIGRAFVFLAGGLTRLADTRRIPSVDPRDNPFSARGRAPRPFVQEYIPTWRNHAQFVNTFYGKRPLSSDRPVYPIMGVVSRDGRFLSGFAWPDCERLGQLFLSCIHPNPLLADRYDARTGKAVTRGKMYFMENNPERLLERFHADFPDWTRPPDAD